MQTSTILLLLGVVALTGANSLSADATWELFKETHGKTYSSKLVEDFRRSLFEKTVEEVKEHNRMYLSGLETYSMEVNHLSDMMLSEVIGEGLGDYDTTEFTNFYDMDSESAAPASVDWRTKAGVVTPVKNQGQCGSCWSFSTTGSMEGQMMLKKQKSVSLSEQQLVDCAKPYGPNGCHGGWMHMAMKYIRDYGLEAETSYPYHASEAACRYNKDLVVAHCDGPVMIPSGNEEALTNAIANVGPIAVAIDVTSSFMRYRAGVFYDSSCNPRRMAHAVLAVGYGTQGGADYYIVKNSWGGSWGDRGYIKMARNRSNNCGIATVPSYPQM